MNRQLFAWTANHSRAYPEYLNVSQQPDGALAITLREPPDANGSEGATRCLVLPWEVGVELMVNLQAMK